VGALPFPPGYARALYPTPYLCHYNTPDRRSAHALCRIDCVAKALLTDETDQFTLYYRNDPAPSIVTVFEYDTEGDGADGGGDVAIDVSGDVTAEEVAVTTAAAIFAAAGFNLAPTVVGASVFVYHGFPGRVLPATEAVDDETFRLLNLELGRCGDEYLPLRWGLLRGFAADPDTQEGEAPPV